MTELETDYLRREIDRQFVERLNSIQAHIEGRESEIGNEMTEIRLSLQRIVDWQQRVDPTLKDMQSIIMAGSAMRWIVVLVVGALAAVGTMATAMEVFKKWLH